jgi:hypothetical protein
MTKHTSSPALFPGEAIKLPWYLWLKLSVRPHTLRGIHLGLVGRYSPPLAWQGSLPVPASFPNISLPVSSFWSFHYSSCISRPSLFLPFRKMCPLNISTKERHHLSRPFGRDVNHHVMRIISSDRLFATRHLQHFIAPQFRRGSMAMNSLSRGQMSYMG